jgi:MOSC domain-containing protein
MAIVEELFIYPFKSARGIACSAPRLAATGFEWDRQWMAVDALSTFISQRTHPRLAQVAAAITGDSLTLRARDLEPLQLPLEPWGEAVSVKVWNDRCAGLDQGDAAAEWISTAVGDALRLVRRAPVLDRMADPKFAGATPTPVSFTDGFPFLVCNQASLTDLNRRMPVPIPMERFRPNIVLSGLAAFEEDRIEVLKIGAITLRLVKPCTRCIITSTDQMSGERSTNPLPVLRKFRFNRTFLGVAFGENAVACAGVGLHLERGAHCLTIARA